MVMINGTSISVTRGDTLDITIDILYPDGSPYTVLAGDVIRFALKQRYTDPEPLICKEIPHAGMNLRLEAEEAALRMSMTFRSRWRAARCALLLIGPSSP